ncbi:DciA family protein [Streptomyces sp. NPDC058611]|uniref:DciA family protein n=1 Tax=unclassified Streptomyces TaxID=2593676 RepID=UPI003660C0F0
MSSGEVSGVDLARVALRAAMEAARKNGVGQKAKKKPRATTAVRRDGRERMGLGAALGALVTERAWELPAAGASLRERWAAIAPDLAGHIAAVAFDPDSGQLTVCPESTGWATKARLEQTRALGAVEPAAPAAPSVPRTCSGHDGERPCTRRALPTRSVCLTHRSQELAGEVA